MSDPLHNLRAETERWLVSRGVPHLIEDYSATTDIWTRARPFLVAVLLLQTLLAFNDRYTGLQQGMVFVGAALLLLAAVAVFNRWRGRRLFDVPQEVDWPELGFFVLAPALLALLVGQAGVRDALIAGIGNVLLLGLTYLIVGFGIIPMIRWSSSMLAQHLRALTRLVSRTLPVLLVLTVFMFINAEIWQIAYAVPPPGFGVASIAICAVGILFLWAGTKSILADVDSVDSMEEASDLVAEAPIGPALSLASTELAPADLTSGARLNLRILLMTSLAVQVVLVGLLVTGFYIFLGLVLVNEEVLRQWTEATDLNELASARVASMDLTLTREHLRVAGLIGVLGALNIAVAGLTDESYRDAFKTDLITEMRENLAVRQLYRRLDSD